MSKLLNDEQIAFLLDNYKGIGNKELTELINKKFDTNFSKQQIKGYKQRYHLDSGLKGRYEKGEPPWNKGKKWKDYMSEESQRNSLKTCFKKGNTPVNHRTIYSERINVDGYVEIKIKEPNKWGLKHRLIWEEAYGPIPKGHKVIFKDGNKQNIQLDNLALVSNSQMLIMNKRDLIYKDKELTESGIMLAQYIDKVNKKCKK